VALDDAQLRRRPIWSRLAGRDIVLGVRPEAILPDAHGELVGSVRSTELVERRKWVSFDLDVQTVTVAADGTLAVLPGTRSTLVASVEQSVPASLWEPFGVTLDVDRLHLFDLQSGRSLD
jgi:hypothetical protein